MKSAKNFLVSASALLVLFSSCQKDVLQEPQSVNSEVTASNAVADTIETAPPVWTSVVYNVNSNVAGFWQGVPAK